MYDTAGWRAILHAAEKGHDLVINQLLNHDPIIISNQRNVYAFLKALACSSLFVLLVLFTEKYNVDYGQVGNQSRAAAHSALRGGHFNIL